MAHLTTNDRMSLAHSLRKPVTLPGANLDAFAGWGDTTTARLRELLAAGATAGEIARELGCTRNAVIGKVYRDGLAFATPGMGGKNSTVTREESFDRYQARLARERLARAKAAADRKARSEARRLANAAPAPHIAILAPAPAPVMRDPMPFTDERWRSGRMCRWSVGEVEGHRGRHLFCAAGVEPGSSYCAEHHRRAHRASEDRSAA